MQGEGVGSQTEEEGDLTSPKELVVEVVEVAVEVRKQELVVGMTMTISALILDHLIPAGIYL